MLEKSVVEHCAPTLAGLKTGNLFCFRFTDRKMLEQAACRMNLLLNRRGVFVRILCVRGDLALIYVYRKSLLRADWSCKQVQHFLISRGYQVDDMSAAISMLSHKTQVDDFPHEIGLFLGFPLMDVVGFIAHCGKNYKHCGCWKVYSNECHARQLFEQYKKCTDTLKKCYIMGTSVSKLAVLCK